MTKSQDAAAVVLRKKEKRKKNRPNNNQTAQIKFPNTLASRLHSSHFSIIYRSPQSDAAELVLAGGSKLGLERRWGHTEHAQGVSAGLGERVPSPPGLVSLAGGRPALLAGNLLSPGVVLPRMGQFDLKGFLLPQSPSWAEVKGSFPHRRPGSGSSRKQPGVTKTRIQTHVWKAEAHFLGSRQLSPVPPSGSATLASRKKGHGCPGSVGEPRREDKGQPYSWSWDLCHLAF